MAPKGVVKSGEMFSPREAGRMLGVSYPTIKQWIYKGRLRTMKTPGGHHRVTVAELERFLPHAEANPPSRRSFRRVSGRNQLVGRVVDVQISGLMAQVKLSIGGQHITSIITAEAVREMKLARGQTAAALIKSTDVMIVRV
jgi:molybdopterin-binding protein